MASALVIVAHVRDRRTPVDFLRFMDDVVKSYPLAELHVVLDNLNIHKNEAAQTTEGYK